MPRSRALWLLLTVGLALRLLYGLAQDPLAPYGPTGGDDTWYLANALALVTDAPPGTAINGISTEVRTLGQPPMFFIAAGIPQALLPPGPAVLALRILQALATTAVAFFGFGLAVQLVRGLPSANAATAHRAGLIAAGALALSPALILESAQVKTESLFIFFVTGGMWAYVEALARSRSGMALIPRPFVPRKPGEGESEAGAQHAAPQQPTDSVVGARHALPLQTPPRPEGEGPRVRANAWRWWIAAGALLGLAALTRAVFLLFPLALVVFTLFALGGRPGWKHALALLAVYAAVVLSWTAYNLVRYQRFVIAGEGLPAFLYIGATGWDDPQEVDQRLEDTLGPAENGSRSSGDFLNAAGSAIGADLPGYLARRLGELGSALLQPHNVELFAGASLRGMALNWWNTDRSPCGLLALTNGDGFWPKLLLYVVHYSAMILGAAGLLLTRHNWRAALPLLGFIAYTLLVHLFLLALPRYLFPIMPFVWVFAGAAVAVWSTKQARALSTGSVL